MDENDLLNVNSANRFKIIQKSLNKIKWNAIKIWQKCTKSTDENYNKYRKDKIQLKTTKQYAIFYLTKNEAYQTNN